MYSISFTALSSNQLVGPNGTANRVAAKVVDSNGVATAGLKLTWSADNGANLDLTVNPATTDANGQAVAYVFSNTVGNANLTATLADGTSASTVINFVAKPETPPVTTPVGPFSISLLSRTSNQLAGPNGSANTVAATVLDSTGAAAAGQTLTWSADNGANLDLTVNPATTDANGQAVAYVFSNTVGNANLTATLADGTFASEIITFVSKTALPGTGDDSLTAFKTDVATFIAYVQQQLDSVGQNVEAALSQLGASVTQSSVTDALSAFETNDETFNGYVEQNVSTLNQNLSAAFLQLKTKYQ